MTVSDRELFTRLTEAGYLNCTEQQFEKMLAKKKKKPEKVAGIAPDGDWSFDSDGPRRRELLQRTAAGFYTI